MNVCPVCGSTFKEIVKNQLIGCPECYYAFQEEIRRNYKSFGITQSYKGSLPKHVKGFDSTLVTRIEVQLKLDEAIEKEEYEKAAFYRDYLKVIDSKYVNGDAEAEDENGN